LSQAHAYGSDLGAAVVVAAGLGTGLGAAPPPATTLPKAVTTAAVAAIFPTASPGGPFGTTSAAITATAVATGRSSTAVATPSSVTTASVAASAIPTGATTRGAPGGAGSLGLSLVDPQGATHQLSALEGLNRPGFALGIGHLYEGKAALATGIPF
jgi:hypothetical protein